jgi:type IV secretory pathway TraG/TraD family ATPase VirD4
MRQGVSVTQQLSKERILTVDDLAALPKGRALVLSAGNRPTLVKTVPWWDGPYAQQVAASVAAHTPKPRGEDHGRD